jgi:ABC-type multidrug transport system fused ATPase/permease subunit
MLKAQSISGYFRKYVGPYWQLVLLLTLLLFGNLALQLINPQIIRQFLDQVELGVPLLALLRIAALFLAVALLQQVVSVLATYMAERLSWKATNKLRVDLAHHCLKLDMSFHHAHSPGELIERIDGDIMALSNFFSRFVIEVVGNALLLIGILAILFYEDWRVGIILSVFALVALLALASFRRFVVPHWRIERQATANLFGFLEERLRGLEDLHSIGAKAFTRDQFHALNREQVKKRTRAAFLGYAIFSTLVTLFGLGVAVAFLIGSRLYLLGTATIGVVYLIFHYTKMMERPINELTRHIQDFQKAAAGLSRVQELLETESQLQESDPIGNAHRPDLETLLSLDGMAVEFRNVSFSYQAQVAEDASEMDGRVLTDVSFHLEPGTVLGLLGRTGSGKTTMARLLFRLYDVHDGEIRVGSPGHMIDIRNIPTDLLRSQVGLITQNVQLFRASVRDNITLFDSAISDERIEHALSSLELQEWLDALPDGLDTQLMTAGFGLSAGEAQLLAFTRIFLRDPSIVILDEASSRLDPVTERLIGRAVQRLLRDRTALIIAHRLETVRQADKIIILEEGKIQEHGRRVDLEQDEQSTFYRLLHLGEGEVLS